MNKNEELNIKRFGYVISALLLIFSHVALISKWPVTPFLFLLTMYFLTGSLWTPVLVKPFYLLLLKVIDLSGKGKNKQGDKDFFNKN